MEKKLKEQCSICVYWSQTGEDSQSRGVRNCVRYPPNANGFPLTKAADWCGEYKEIPLDKNLEAVEKTL